MDSRVTQQCNMCPYVYAVYWLPSASPGFLLVRKCNWLAKKMLITCVMQNARAHKLQWSGPTVHSSTVTWTWGREFILEWNSEWNRRLIIYFIWWFSWKWRRLRGWNRKKKKENLLWSKKKKDWNGLRRNDENKRYRLTIIIFRLWS